MLRKLHNALKNNLVHIEIEISGYSVIIIVVAIIIALVNIFS